MNRYVQLYLEKADENFKLYEFLNEAEKFEAWQLTAIFYSALCLVKAYLYNKGFPENSINSHECIKNLLSQETEAKRLGIFNFYKRLYFDSRDARYYTKKISKARINNAITNYKEVKKQLKIQ